MVLKQAITCHVNRSGATKLPDRKIVSTGYRTPQPSIRESDRLTSGLPGREKTLK